MEESAGIRRFLISIRGIEDIESEIMKKDYTKLMFERKMQGEALGRTV